MENRINIVRLLSGIYKVKCQVFDQVNGQIEDIYLVLDTGCSLTSLSKSTAKALGLKINKSNIVRRTANGEVKAELANLPMLSLGGDNYKNQNIDILELPEGLGYSGLLGMDILGSYNFEIDTDESTLILKDKQGIILNVPIEHKNNFNYTLISYMKDHVIPPSIWKELVGEDDLEKVIKYIKEFS